ncbi:hypothetical protein [uncultured Dysosmobacter sp.]|nr:hypothetical protein [uncultured Dysosmobacter sp.]
MPLTREKQTHGVGRAAFQQAVRSTVEAAGNSSLWYILSMRLLRRYL